MWEKRDVHSTPGTRERAAFSYHETNFKKPIVIINPGLATAVTLQTERSIFLKSSLKSNLRRS